MTIQTLLSELNESQRAAAQMPRQHAIVLAGAGCGKTKTVVARAAWIIANEAPAGRIQILTFTRNAAREIVERLRIHLGDAVTDLKASTFHTWCTSLIRRAPALFGSCEFTLIDRDDQLGLFRLFRGKDTADRIPPAKELLNLYSLARNKLIPLDQAIEDECPENLQHFDVIAAIMSAYDRRKRERRYIDYDDCLEIVAKRMHASEEVRHWVGSNYDYILVDEVQDTSPLQWQLLVPLQGYATLFCVGDDAQSIYGFRGADFWSVHSFSERIKNAITLRLTENYRSTQEILDVSNWLIARSDLNYDKQLVAARGSGLKPQLHVFPTEWEEARWIAEDILKRYKEGAPWKHHMILTRTVWGASKIQWALLKSQIPYVVIGGLSLLQSAHVKDVLSVLRIVANTQDELAWIRFLELWPGIGEVKAAKFTEQMTARLGLDECLAILREHPLVVDAASVLSEVHMNRHNVAEAYFAAVETLSGTLECKYQNDWERREPDFDLVGQLATNHATISDFLEQYVLDPVWSTGLLRTDRDDVVKVITIHSAKGTECETCYVTNVTPGAFPLTWTLDDFDAVEEERRVLYVALTRAKNSLVVTRCRFAQSAPSSGKPQSGLLPETETYFLNDVPDELFETQFHALAPQSTTLSVAATEMPELGIQLRSTSETSTVRDERRNHRYIVKNGESEDGPFTYSQLQLAFRLKRLSGRQLVRASDGEDWSLVEELFDFAR